jgi:hypothetical protein
MEYRQWHAVGGPGITRQGTSRTDFQRSFTQTMKSPKGDFPMFTPNRGDDRPQQV